MYKGRMNWVKERLVNVGLRFLSLGSRFIFMFAMAKYLNVADVGKYGLFSAIVSFSFLVLGGDYYTYSQRQILADQSRFNFIISHHIRALGKLYLFLLPVFFFIFPLSILPWNLLGWYYLLLIFEHVSQEIYRLLITINKQIWASIVLFLRIGLWAVVLVVFMMIFPEMRSLENVFLYWVIGSFLSTILGGFIIWKHGRPWQNWSTINWDKKWLKKGYKVGFSLLFSTLCFRSIQTLDRVSVEFLNDEEFLGVYVFFIGAAMSVQKVLEPGVIQFLYPKLIGFYKNSDFVNFKKTYREFKWSIIVVSILCTLVFVYLMPFLLTWINKEAYTENIMVFWLCLIAVFLLMLSYIPHYCLYAFGFDKKIITSHALSVVVFIVCIIIFSFIDSRYATILALILTFLLLVIIKYIYARKELNRIYSIADN
ncbi:MAG: O-antigen/teichoic acid export membrane protein [Parvicella sp.]|jgi:O-antigen/teichoic acid export membrane protein